MLTLDTTRAVRIFIHSARDGLQIAFDRPGPVQHGSKEGAGRVVAAAAQPDCGDRVVRAVRRMLRLDEDLSAFHALCRRHASHRAAAQTRFGRLLRGATLFEDIVKVICTCNVAWRQTVNMVERLTTVWGLAVPASGADTDQVARQAKAGRAAARGSVSNDAPVGSRVASGKPSPSFTQPASRAFPTPQALAAASPDQLRAHARLGYRAEFVSRLARAVVDGRLDLDALEHFAGPTRDLHRKLRELPGIGPYGASSLCMLLGRYDCLAIDTELLRFLKSRHPRRRFTPATIQRYYAAWNPWQFLAYWYELWSDYEQRHGPAHTWQPDATGRAITTS